MKSLLLALLALAAPAASAHADSTGTCVAGDCVGGTGTRVYPDSLRYEGTFRDGRRHGTGTLTSASGDRYAGPWDNGQRGTGTARIEGDDGTGRRYVYEGAVVVGRSAGRGVETWDDGERYEGEFLSDAKHGQGVLTLPSGTVYDGEFANGMQSGQGRFAFADGSSYVGGFRDGRYEGDGTYGFPSRATWAGRWAADAPVGEGVYADSAGTALRTGPMDALWTLGFPGGCRRGDCVDGTGTFRWPSGFLHTGRFAHGHRDGPGETTAPSGSSTTATFVTGVPTGRVRISSADGTLYEGDTDAEGRADGAGQIRFADGRAYNGAFARGRENGAGVLTTPDGCRYAGTFVTDRSSTRMTEGTFGCPDGTAFRGGWNRGLPHGDGVWTFANGVTWTGRFDTGNGADDGDWADAAGVVYARAPYANTPRAGAAMTLTSVPVVGRVRVTTESAPGTWGVSIGSGDPAAQDRLRDILRDRERRP